VSEPRFNESPIVTAAICTRDRPALLARALESILAQRQTGIEILIVNHGRGSVSPELLGKHGEAIEIGERPAGAAMAAAFHRVRGAYLAFLDEHDQWTPDHLRDLIAELEAHPDAGAAHGLATWLDQQGEQMPSPAHAPWPPPAQTPFAGKSQLLFRTSAVRRAGGFDAALDAFAEWDLLIRISDWWPIRHVPAASAMLQWFPDRDEYRAEAEAARNVVRTHAMARRIRFPGHTIARPPVRPKADFDPETWTIDRRELAVNSVFSSLHSYGSVNGGLLPAVARLGVDLFLGRDNPQMQPALRHLVNPRDDRPRITFFYETGSRPRDVPVRPVIQYTMYEQDLLPQVHVEEINRYVDLLLVPCRMNLETFREAGVRIPIKVLHHGIDSDAFPFLERPERPVFTFGTFGQQNVRKGIDVLLAAFQDEFRKDEPVRLIFKATNTAPWLRPTDPRVELRSGFLDHAALLEYLRELDAFVLPSRGEGFGLCGLEALATGLPLIATNWSGPVEYLDPDDSFPLNYRLVPTDGMPFGAMRLFGNWAEPSYEHLRELMRRLYEHRDLARAAGERASLRIHRDWQWDRVARQLVADIDLLARGISPAG
jgi:glycosyltransferase involved in cell wall biosynthesis